MIYIPIGVFLLLRKNKRPIRNRSHILVSIAHWSNFFETFLLLVSLYFSFNSSVHHRLFDAFYQIIVIVVHYSYFIAYMLRCYRVYFIFNLDTRIDEHDSFFKKNIHRAGQRWLIKIFLIILWPVAMIACLRLLIPSVDEYFPPSYYVGEEKVSDISEGIYLGILFIEELFFIFAVFKLRKVNDDFNMTLEVTAVCVLWVVTGMFSVFPYGWIWRIEVVIRNHIIMIISSVYPLVKSLNPETFEENLTLEMVESLELVLQNVITLDAFEKSINSTVIKHYHGLEILQLWLKCENFKHKQTSELKAEIIQTGEKLKMRTIHPNTIQAEAFHILNQYFFELFKESLEYKSLLRDISRQQIYLNRIMQTSLSGTYLYSEPH